VHKGKRVKRRSLHITEHLFPHIIALEIPPRGLDPQTSAAILDFHRSPNAASGKPLRNDALAAELGEHRLAAFDWVAPEIQPVKLEQIARAKGGAGERAMVVRGL
jgi:hypothetical protein